MFSYFQKSTPSPTEKKVKLNFGLKSMIHNRRLFNKTFYRDDVSISGRSCGPADDFVFSAARWYVSRETIAVPREYTFTKHRVLFRSL